MRITARLAYTQLKINRKRTMWTLLGIALSAALITAVCSLVASGHVSLIHIYGRDYSEQAGIPIVSLLIPAAILSVIIITMAVVVISNAFRVSAGERRAQFGILKSVGTTKKQITATVMYESVFLSLIGIPAGVAAGLVLSFFSVQMANHYLSEVNSLVNIMMHELIIVLEFVVSWQAILAASILSFFTVLLSAWLPARKAAKATAIDSIRRVDEVFIDAKEMKTRFLTGRLFGVEGMLAAKNMKRSKRNLRATIISLTVGTVLFICLGSLSGQLNKALDYMYSYSICDVIAEYSSSYESSINKKTGKKETILTAPIDSKTAESIVEKLRKYKGAEIFGAGGDMSTYTAAVSDEMITQEIREAVFTGQETQTHEIEAEIISLDSRNYASLCEQAGVPVGSNILLNRYDHNDNGNEVTIQPFSKKMKSLKLMKADGSWESFPVDGQLAPDQVPDDLLYLNSRMVRLVVPEIEMRNYTWQVDVDDEEDFIAFANDLMNELYPEVKESGYMEQGFSTRVFKMQDYMKVMNIGIDLFSVFVQSFVVLLALIGLTNVISTMTANVQMRAREVAVLQSMGMTMDGVKRMIAFESIICSMKSLLIGLPIAIAFTYIINIPIRATFPVPYEFPFAAVVCSAVVIFGITGGTMWISSKGLQRNNIAETIRSEN